MTEPYDYDQFRRKAQAVSAEHQQAIDASEQTGKDLAHAEAEYHKQLAIAVGRLKPQGATVAETLAKGCPEVVSAKESRDQCAAIDRAAMERIRLCRDDRAVLLTLGAWSRAAEAWDA